MPNTKSVKVFARGGLGNQLFQYGTALNLATQFKLSIFVDDLFLSTATKNKNVDDRKLELDSFMNELSFRKRNSNIGNKILSKLLAWQRLLGDHFPRFVLKFGFYANENFDQFETFKTIKGAITINSYCGNREYLEGIEEELVKNITAVKNPSEWYLNYLQKIRSENPTSLHVRLGDYKQLSKIYGSPDVCYYAKALKLIEKLDGKRPVWLFSDEPEIAEKLFDDVIKFAEIVRNPINTRPIEHLNLLANSRNLVCANSSFSWWAAYLGSFNNPEKTIIFPRPMFNSTKYSEPFNWLPAHWITLGRAINQNKS